MEDHLDQARRALDRREPDRATVELRAAAELLRWQASDAEHTTRAAAVAAAARLEKLAQELARGEPADPGRLGEASYLASRAEVLRLRDRAGSAWRQDDARLTGAALTLAAEHLARATRYAGATTDTTPGAALVQVLTIGDRLTRGDAVSAGSVGAAIEELPRQIIALDARRVTRRTRMRAEIVGRGCADTSPVVPGMDRRPLTR